MLTFEREAKKAALTDILYQTELLDTQVKRESQLANLSTADKPAVFDDQFICIDLQIQDIDNRDLVLADAKAGKIQNQTDCEKRTNHTLGIVLNYKKGMIGQFYPSDHYA